MKIEVAGHQILFDESDAESVLCRTWSVVRHRHTFYAQTHVGETVKRLHVLLIPGAKIVDHRNGNGLDNRRENLRACNHSQNARNAKKVATATSKYKGVVNRWGSFYAAIWDGEKQIYLGAFKSEISAALAYDVCAERLFGEFCRLNFEAGSRACYPAELEIALDRCEKKLGESK
jgi:hypothetical protein